MVFARDIDLSEDESNIVKGSSSTAFLFAFTLLVLACAIVIWNAWQRMDSETSHQIQLAKQDVNGTSSAITQSVKELRRAVTLFAEREIILLNRLANDSEDLDAYDLLVDKTKKVFPDAFAVTLADAQGTPYMDDFDGHIVEICQRDIKQFAENKIPPNIVIHPNPITYHIDIMVDIELPNSRRNIFFVSFIPHFISHILANSSLYGHKLVLVNKNRKGLREITTKSSRQDLPEEAFYLSELENKNISYSLPVPETSWQLVDIIEPQLAQTKKTSLWFETVSVLLVLLIVSVLTFQRLRFANKKIIKQNNELMFQTDLLSEKQHLIEKEREQATSILEGMTDAFIILDKDNRILEMNTQAENIFQAKREEVKYKIFWDEIPEAVSAFYKKFIQNKNNQVVFEAEGLYAPTSKWLKLTAYPSKEYISLFFRDITVRYQREVALENSERRVRTILNTAVDAIITFNTHSIITSMNSSALKMFGYTENELLGLNVYSLMPDEYQNKVLDFKRVVAEETYSKVVELCACRNNGSIFPVEFTLGRMHLDDKISYVVIIRDISNRQKREALANKALIDKLEAENASKCKSVFLANMSHEIRTPLTSIIGFADTLLIEDLSDKERQQSVDTIIRSGNHLLNIINQILDLSKIEADKLEVENIAFSPFQLIDDITSLIKVLTDDKAIGFSVIYETEIPELIMSDPIRLKQILINLCSNAVKFTDEGNVCIYVKSDRKKETIQFSVEDTGIGLKHEQQEKIFDAFTQADISTTREYGGTGLGLTLSLQFVKMLGGELVLSSELNKGSCFKVIVPTGDLTDIKFIKNESAIKHVPSHNEAIMDKTDYVSGKVLIAEDTEDIQLLLKFYISKTGAEVHLVDNGKEAVNAVDDGGFDLIFMDMQMPVMDGLTAVSILREKGYQGPIIALTANALKKDRERCIAAGCDSYLSKPVARKELNAIVVQYLKDKAMN